MQRIQKILSSLGVGSRRTIEQMILDGRVEVNGIVITPGTKVNAQDIISIDGKQIKLCFDKNILRMLIYNKPLGEISSRFDPKHKKTVFDNLPPIDNGRWVQVGRLDINTSGLLLFTNDGDIANKLMHPSYACEREYLVRVHGNVTQIIINNLLKGVFLDDGLSCFKSIEFKSKDGYNSWYKVILTEGKNREVRRLWASEDIIVNRLIRIRYDSFVLPKDLAIGAVRELTSMEIKQKLGRFL